MVDELIGHFQRAVDEVGGKVEEERSVLVRLNPCERVIREDIHAVTLLLFFFVITPENHIGIPAGPERRPGKSQNMIKTLRTGSLRWLPGIKVPLADQRGALARILQRLAESQCVSIKRRQVVVDMGNSATERIPSRKNRCPGGRTAHLGSIAGEFDRLLGELIDVFCLDIRIAVG